MIAVARSALPLRLIYKLTMPIVDPRSKRLGPALGSFTVCIYGPGAVAIIAVVTDSSATGTNCLKPSNEYSQFSLAYHLAAHQNRSIKFNSQWDLG